MSDRERIVWGDVAKGLAIILMVFGHVWRGLFEAGILTNSALFDSIDRAIYLFHMPLFFFLSGMFVSTGVTPANFGANLLRRANAYLYPLLIWSWILALSRVAAGGATNREALSLFDAALYPFPPKDIFWFLWALFLMQTLTSLALLLPKRLHLPLGIAAALGALGYSMSGASLPLVHDTIVNLPYFLAGIGFAAIGGRAIGTLRQGLTGLALFAAAECVAILAPQPLAGVTAILAGLVAVLGAVLLLAWLVTRFAASRTVDLFAFLGTATMAIYVAHVIVLAAVRIALTKIGIHDVLAHVVVATGLAIVLPLLLLEIASRLRINRWLGLGPSPTPLRRISPRMAPNPAKP